MKTNQELVRDVTVELDGARELVCDPPRCSRRLSLVKVGLVDIRARVTALETQRDNAREALMGILSVVEASLVAPRDDQLLGMISLARAIAGGALDGGPSKGGTA